MKKKVIRLTEGDLRRIVNRSVKKVLGESFLDRSWDNIIQSDNFWGESPEQIHTYLLKKGYCVGMPKEDVMALIDWARGMFFLPLELPKRDKDKIINIIMCRLKGDDFYTTWGGEKQKMSI